MTKSREDEIRTCFDYTTIEFYHSDDLDDFDMLLETFRRDSVVEIDEQNTNTTIVIYLGRKKVWQAYCYGQRLGFGRQVKQF